MSAAGDPEHTSIVAGSFSTPLQCAVVGIGRAGQMRISALQTVAGAECVAQISRHRPSEITLAQVYTSREIDAVIVCLENEQHEEVVRCSLAHGKHVLVEYPMAFSEDAAAQLFTEAKTQHRIVHVGLVGLLSPIHREIRSFVRKEPWHRFTYEFRGGLYGWVKHEATAGRYGQLAVARLHRLWDCFGPLQLQSAHRIDLADGYTMVIRFETQQGCMLELIEDRQRGQRRQLSVVGEHGNGEAERFIGTGRRAGVFRVDTLAFINRVHTDDVHGRYVDERTILDILGLAEQVNRALSG